MQPARASRLPVGSIARRTVAVVTTVSCAALVAVGCGGDRAGSAAGDADADALAWLPADTWLVATGDLSAERIDEAVATLDRLPIWALAEGFLPAGDGAGLRRALLERVTAGGDPEGGQPTATELEAAFGDRVGFAIVESDLAAIEADADMPFLAWVEVDDEERALEVAGRLFDGEDREDRHEGRSYFESARDEATWTVQDDLLLVTTTPERMRALIDVREGDESLAGDETGGTVRAATGDAFASVAVQTDPLLDAAPQLARRAAEELPEGDPDAARALAAADRLQPALDADSVRDLVPDWVAGSITVDEVGLRMRAAWSDPRELADADPGARELVERMPASVGTASGIATRGDELQRIQDAWADARDEADLDLRDAIGCAGARRWACQLGVEALLTLLEGEELADAMARQGDRAVVLVQELGPALQAAVAQGTAGPRGQAAPAPRHEGRILELVAPRSEELDWQPDDELTGAMRRAGISVVRDDEAHVVRVAPASPMGRALRGDLGADARAGLAMLGIDPAALLAPAGLRLAPERIGDLEVFGLPIDAPSAVAGVLETGDDPLAGSEDYRAAVDAASPPDDVGAWAWVDVAGLVEGALASAATESPDLRRALPTVRNNLADVPGALSWTTVEEVDGERVGVAEAVLPILE